MKSVHPSNIFVGDCFLIYLRSNDSDRIVIFQKTLETEYKIINAELLFKSVISGFQFLKPEYIGNRTKLIPTQHYFLLTKDEINNILMEMI